MEKSDLPNTIRELMDSIDENGELPLLKRYWLGELLQRNNDQDIDPWLALQSISAHKVQDIWKQYFASEQFPIEVLSIADALIISGGDTTHIEKLLAECKTALDNKFLLGEDYFQGVYAGFAMWAAARNVAYGNEIDDEASSEMDLEPEEWDASFFCLNGLGWGRCVGGRNRGFGQAKRVLDLVYQRGAACSTFVYPISRREVCRGPQTQPPNYPSPSLA